MKAQISMLFYAVWPGPSEIIGYGRINQLAAEVLPDCMDMQASLGLRCKDPFFMTWCKYSLLLFVVVVVVVVNFPVTNNVIKKFSDDTIQMLFFLLLVCNTANVLMDLFI